MGIWRPRCWGLSLTPTCSVCIRRTWNPWKFSSQDGPRQSRCLQISQPGGDELVFNGVPCTHYKSLSVQQTVSRLPDSVCGPHRQSPSAAPSGQWQPFAASLCSSALPTAPSSSPVSLLLQPLPPHPPGLSLSPSPPSPPQALAPSLSSPHFSRLLLLHPHLSSALKIKAYDKLQRATC